MAENLTLENFTCSICRDVYSDPVLIPCGNNHVVCRDCVQPVLTDQEPKCPVCRTKFKSGHVKSQQSLVRRMSSMQIPCFGCKEKVLVSEMNQHIAACDRIDKSISYFKPVHETTQRIPKNLPNRSTFNCPFCTMKNFDVNGLVKHCNECHNTIHEAVVCPVCASMPWGNKNQASMDFLSHLNLRHKFEYDTYVDYGQDDDAMLLAAIQASLKDS